MAGGTPQEIVAAGYDAIGPRYAAWQAAIEDDPRERYVRELLSRLPGEPDILEIGCGAGVEPTPTFASVGHLVGVDISAAQIERARTAVPNAHLIHGDITETSFSPMSFDAVVALFVLTHIPLTLVPPLLDRIEAWLRPGGLLLATFGSGASHEQLVDNWLGAPMFFAGHDEATNERLLRGAGLEVLESQVEHMHEPETEPGNGPARVAFQWILGRRD